MRIIGGVWRGRTLEMPPASITRPTSDRARQAIFNIIEHNYGRFQNTIIADLCAGSGAMGIEALSRGAQHATFVENHHTALTALKKNIEKITSGNQTSILKTNVAILPILLQQCDYIFFDPPYNLNLETSGMEQIFKKKWAHSNTIICIETEATNTPSNFNNFAKIDERCYGRAGFTFWKLSST